MIQDIAAKMKLDSEIVRRLVLKFLNNTQGTMGELRSAVSEMDRKKINHLAHTIGGTAGNLYLERVAQVALELERVNAEEPGVDLSEYPNRLDVEIKTVELALDRESEG